MLTFHFCSSAQLNFTKMGFEDDLENLYQILDSPCRGYVDSQQIQDFHQTLYLKKIGADQVDAALKQVCGDQKVCSKKQFVPLLLELERRRTIEERAWWDFKSLDMNGMDQITIQDALFLFKITLGDKFTMIYWGKFLLSRNYSKEPTSFEEVKMWLCNIPDGSSETCSNQAIFEEISNLQTEKNKMDYRNFKKIKALQVSFIPSVCFLFIQFKIYRETFKIHKKKFKIHEKTFKIAKKTFK